MRSNLTIEQCADEAIRNLNPAVLKRCLEEGFDPNGSVSQNHHPLLVAATEGSWHCLEVLLQNGSDPRRAVSPTGNTPLKMACVRGHMAAMKMLLANGDNPNARSMPEGRSCAHIVVKNTSTHQMGPKMLALLHENGASLDVRDDQGYTLLHEAVYGHSCIDWLAARAPHLLEARSNDGRTPLMHAIASRMDKSALALLEYSQDLQARSAQGFSLLEMARDAHLENVIQRLEVLEHAQRAHDAISAIANIAKGAQASSANRPA